MAQNTVFAQLIKLVPRSRFESSVQLHGGDRGIRSLDCWSWFGALLFGQLSGHNSIRAIERVFAHSDPKMKKLGFGPVRKSTLADANRVRPLEIFEDIFSLLLQRAKAGAPKNGFHFQGQVLALDSSTIELCLSLCPWARFHSDRAAVKLNTAIDIAGDLPEFVVLDNAITHDLHSAKMMAFKPDTTVVMDRNYIQYKWMNELNQKGIFFVTRFRDCLKFKVLRSQPTDRTRGHICDQIIYPIGTRACQFYKGKMRRISYRCPETGKKLVFLTNRFDLATQTICDLYKARWKVELFFKTLKQYLKIKKFLGTSVNAVKAQIWVALIAYLMVQIWRFQTKSYVSIPNAMAVIGTLLLLKEPMTRLLGALPRVTRHPPNAQLEFQI